jgi:aminomethyltransferase
MPGVHVSDYSDYYTQLAIQGPRAAETMAKLTNVDLSAIKNYWFTWGTVCGLPNTLIARTGYTGEDGFEIYVPSDEPTSIRVWNEVLEAGREFGILPCGLGARNTLRLESAMALYGHEIGATITPWEANLGWIVKLDKGDFVGRDALVKQKEQGITRRLIGFEMQARGIGRDGYEVQVDGEAAGWVTSGGPAPTLNKNIGLCYLPSERCEPGRVIQVMVRNQPVEAVTVPTPFYKRAK